MTVRSRTKFVSLVTLLSMTTALVPPAAFAAPLQANDDNTTTPIKHVIVIYGENRSFDHLYATYQPQAGETVNNLLSEGIINADGTPGENSAQATQYHGDRYRYLSDCANQDRTVHNPATADSGRTKGQQRYQSAVQHLRPGAERHQRSVPEGFETAAHRCDWADLWRARHPVAERQQPSEPPLLPDRRVFPMMRMQPARCIGFTRCGSRWIAISATRARPIRAAA